MMHAAFLTKPLNGHCVASTLHRQHPIITDQIGFHRHHYVTITLNIDKSRFENRNLMGFFSVIGGRKTSFVHPPFRLQWKETLRHFATAFEKGNVKSDPEGAKKWFDQARKARQEGDSTTALNSFLQALRLDPTNPKYAIASGLMFHHVGNWKEAIKFFTTAFEMDPDNPDPILFRIRSLEQDPDIKTALPKIGNDLDLLVQKNPNNAEYLIMRAVYAKDKFNDQFGAKEDFENALRLSPGMFGAYVGLGEVNAILGNYVDAAKAFTGGIQMLEEELLQLEGTEAKNEENRSKIVNVRNKLSELYVQRGQVFAVAEDKVNAQKDIDTSIKYNSQNYIAYGRKGLFLIQDEKMLQDATTDIVISAEEDEDEEGQPKKKKEHPQIREALRLFEKQIRLFPEAEKKDEEYVKALTHKGLCEYLLGNYAEAVKTFTEVLPLNPANTLALTQRAQSYDFLKDYEAAIRDYDMALKYERDEKRRLQIQCNRCKALVELGRADEAIEELNKITLTDPNNANAWHIKSLAYEKKGLYRNSQLAMDTFVSLSESHLANLARGMKNYEKGLKEQAALDFVKALKDNEPGVLSLLPEVFEIVASIFFTLNKLDEAIYFYTRAIARKPSDTLYADRAAAYFRKEKPLNTIEDFSSAIHLNPNKVDYYVHRGTAKVAAFKVEEALVDFQTATKMDPGNVDIKQRIEFTLRLIDSPESLARMIREEANQQSNMEARPPPSSISVDTSHMGANEKKYF